MPQYIDAYGFILLGKALCFCSGFLGFYAKGKNNLTIFRVLCCCILWVAFNMLTFQG
jgi:hypothetical protein